MMTALLLASVLAQEELPGIKTRFWELKDAGKARAIVLVHGLSAHVFDERKANEALSPSWQSSESTICTMLAEHGSVFAFSYSQNRKVQDLASTLLPHVEKLKTDGFSEIVLVGFSAGGILVRTFVEDHPKAGVTKVVQVCPPNGGSGLGKLERAVRGDQEIFVRSLRTEEREACVRERAEKGLRIPDGVEFVVVVGSVAGSGDGVLSRSSQWPQELRDQGIPAVKVETAHGLAMRTEACSKTLCRLIVTPQPRWTQEGVQAARKEILD